MTPPFPKCVRLSSKPHLFCPGCGHPNVLKALGFAIDELGVQKDVVFGIDIGCSLLAWNYFNLNTIQTHHGRTIPVMVGFKTAAKERICIAYLGDGGAYAIGIGHLVTSAMRNDNVMVIVVNNAVYGMTGGQESPTTFSQMKTTTTPYGADEHWVLGSELARHLNPQAFVARGIATQLLPLKQIMKQAIQHQIDGKGMSFVEVLSQCPTNWKTNARQTLDFLNQEMTKHYKVGVL